MHRTKANKFTLGSMLFFFSLSPFLLFILHFPQETANDVQGKNTDPQKNCRSCSNWPAVHALWPCENPGSPQCGQKQESLMYLVRILVPKAFLVNEKVNIITYF